MDKLSSHKTALISGQPVTEALALIDKITDNAALPLGRIFGPILDWVRSCEACEGSDDCAECAYNERVFKNDMIEVCCGGALVNII